MKAFMAKKCKFLILARALLGSLLMYLAFVVVTKEKLMMIRAPLQASHKSTNTSRNTQITLLLRMPGKIMDYRARYYCDLFRSTVLFWPPSYGKTVIVLDEESQEDHEFGEIVINHTRKHFPEYRLEVTYEALPKNKRVLDFPDARRKPSYNRQLWSSFFFDLYTNDPIIAWMDSDCLLYTSPSPRDLSTSRMPSSA